MVPRAEILEKLWGYPRRTADLRVVEVWPIGQRRIWNPELILTVRGTGYASRRLVNSTPLGLSVSELRDTRLEKRARLSAPEVPVPSERSHHTAELQQAHTDLPMAKSGMFGAVAGRVMTRR